MSRAFLTPVALPADPANPLEAATKQYVDNLVLTKAGLTPVRSQFAATGGGVVAVSPAIEASWSGRFVAMAVGRGNAYDSSAGYFDIYQPAASTVITGVGGASNVTVTANGVPLPAWNVLYYILPIGGNSTSLPANFRVVHYTGTPMTIPDNWVQVAARNGDVASVQIRFINGISLYPGQSWTPVTGYSGLGQWTHPAVRMATTVAGGNLSLTGAATIDGIVAVTGDRVLVKNQTTLSQNGIWLANTAGAWTRATDADASAKIAGATVSIDQGTTQGGQVWTTTFATVNTLGTTGMNWFRVLDQNGPQTVPELRTAKIDSDPPGSADILLGTSINANGKTIDGLADPATTPGAAADWAATKGYVDAKVAVSYCNTRASATQALSSGLWVMLTLNTEIDNYDVTNNNGQLVIKTAGVYQCTGQVAFDQIATAVRRSCAVSRNSVTSGSAGSPRADATTLGYLFLNCSGMIRCAVGDTLELQAFVGTTGQSTRFTGSEVSWLNIQRIPGT
jgi:hypothetical protein